MKSLILSTLTVLSTLAMTSPASASFYQIKCGNAEGTAGVADGHMNGELFVTERTWGAGPRGYMEKRITMRPHEAKIEVLETQSLHEERHQGCSEGQSIGLASLFEAYYEQVRIEKADGSLFSENTMGVSRDRKSVEAFWICEKNMNSQIPCKDLQGNR